MLRSSSSLLSGSSPTPPKPKVWPLRAEDYELRDEIGQGVSAKVLSAWCIPLQEMVAIKILDLERHDPGKLEEIRKEAQTMNLLSHPNLVQSLASFVVGADLWVIMPYFAGGSVLNLIKCKHPGGLDEPIIATIVKEVLKALDYFHRNGNIHRDVKAGNILIDSMGNVKLADFGVAASWWGSFGTNNHATFVGTPCWMAPEVMEQSGGYGPLADIWSLGITLLELAHGSAPFARYPPMKVLMMTLQNPPPTLEESSAVGARQFSKPLRELVSMCLQKDPNKRPSAAKLLECKFVSMAKNPHYIVKHLLEPAGTLAERVKALKDRENARRGAGGPEPDARSQQEYQRGVSNWIFDVEELKAQAAALDDGSGSTKVQKGRFVECDVEDKEKDTKEGSIGRFNISSPGT